MGDNLKYFAGIGSRKTPRAIKLLMDKLSPLLIEQGYILRSGGASGADKMWEDSYNQHGGQSSIYLANDVCEKSLEIAERFHPRWDLLTDYGRRLHARNGYQILGRNLDYPSEFVICWTEDGKLKGGTAQAMRIALHYKIPIYNLALTEGYEKIHSRLLTNALLG